MQTDLDKILEPQISTFPPGTFTKAEKAAISSAISAKRMADYVQIIAISLSTPVTSAAHPAMTVVDALYDISRKGSL